MSRKITATLVLLAFTVASCRTWTPIEGIPDPMPEQVRVELLSGERVELVDAGLEADTLVGRLQAADRAVRIPITQIAALESGESRGGLGVALLVVVVPIVALGIAFVLEYS